MKKGFLLIICMLLLVTAIFPAQADVIQAKKTLTKEGTEAFLELVNPHYSGDYYLLEGQADLRIWCPDGPAFAQEDEGSING